MCRFSWGHLTLIYTWVLRTRTDSLISNLTMAVKVLMWRTASNFHLSEWKLRLSPCVQGFLLSGDRPCTVWHIMSASNFPCILAISQLDCYFLRPLFTGYSNLKHFWSKDFPPFKKVAWLNLYCEFYDWRQTLEMCTGLSGHSTVLGWLRTAYLRTSSRLVW
jgi:hypothetical protein